MSTALIPRTTLTQLCAAWTQSEARLRSGFTALHEATTLLAQAFGQYPDTSYRFRIETQSGRHYGSLDYSDPAEVLLNLKGQVWSAITERLELRKILSMKRLAELDEQLKDPKQLPEITEANVLAMLETNLNLMGQFLEEKIRECYEWLRPSGWTRTQYQTNIKSMAAGVGRKIILTWALRSGCGYGNPFSVNYGHHQDRLRALDQVFHMLDGQSLPESYYGELCDAISKIPAGQNTCTTRYFKARCFHNNNLHLEFLRADLLDRFNLLAGGARLPDAQAAA
jgi:hypothetical protein